MHNMANPFSNGAHKIITSYVAHNALPVSELMKLISKVHNAIASLASGAASAELRAAAASLEVQKPSVAQIRKSVRHDEIVSFIDGRSYKVLKRHLTAHGLNPKKYRERYGLPPDYPMVAPGYAEQRSQLAKAISLGVPQTHR